MVKSQVGRPRGVLRGAPRGTLRHAQHAPSRDLAFWIEHYWIVEWNLTAPYVAETLPHPSVHLVLERGCSRITGVMLGRFSRTLDGLGGVFGIKFRPGAFRPILGRAVSTIANRLLDPHDLFGDIEREVLDAPDESSRIATAERVLRERLPGEDEKVEEVNRIMDFVLEDSAITRVDHLSARCGVSPRTLQRLFSEYDCTKCSRASRKATSSTGRPSPSISATSIRRTSFAISRSWWEGRRKSTRRSSPLPEPLQGHQKRHQSRPCSAIEPTESLA